MLLVKIMLSSKLHYRKCFKLKHISFEILNSEALNSEAPPPLPRQKHPVPLNPYPKAVAIFTSWPYDQISGGEPSPKHLVSPTP